MSLLPRRHAQNWEIYASLLFLFFYFVGEPHPSPLSATLSAGALLLFLSFYFAAYWLPPYVAATPIMGIALLGVMLIRAHSGASVFLCYSASLACYLYPARYGLAWTGAMLTAFLLLAGGAGYPETYLAINSLVIVAVAAIYLQARRSALITERLRLREAELASIHRASERQRIAHDLHDQLGQYLVLIALKADLARKQISTDAAAADQELSQIGETARETLGTVRRVVGGYSARPFSEALSRGHELLQLSCIEAVIDVAGSDVLTDEQECFLGLILSEAIANVVRHARAKECRIRLAVCPGEIILEIADDGRGALRYEGFGTGGMRERALKVGGQLSIRRDGGTLLTVRIPVPNRP